MADTAYLTGRQQVQALQHQQAQDALTLCEAYLGLAASAHGKLVLDHLTATVLLQPCADLIDEGKRRLVLQMLRTIAEAPGRMEQLRKGQDGHDTRG